MAEFKERYAVTGHPAHQELKSSLFLRSSTGRIIYIFVGRGTNPEKFKRKTLTGHRFMCAALILKNE